MNRQRISTALAAVLLAGGLGVVQPVLAHGQGHGMGPNAYGMMGGQSMAPPCLAMMGQGGQGMMGPGHGMMGHGGQGMMGPGHGMMGPGGQGMMGPGMGMMGQGGQGMMGPGYGMMGPGGQGMMGPGMGTMGQGGQGMMGPGMGMMGPGGQGMPGAGAQSRGYLDRDLSEDDVSAILAHRLTHQGNPRLRVGKVEARDDDTFVADIETVDGSLVERYLVDRHTGVMQRGQ